MSRWLNNPVAIGASTREIVVGARVPWLIRLRRPAPASASVPAVEPASVAIPEEYCCTEAGLLDALRAALAATPATADAITEADVGAQRAAAPIPAASAQKRSACMVLDDFWGNHAILRGDFRTLRARELEEIVLAHFADTYGIAGESLIVRFSVQRGGRALFASAMSRALHDSIHDVSTAEQVDISRLRLGLPEMLNRIDASAVSDEGLLLFVADELMQAVMVEQHRWVAYDAQRLFPGDAADASRLAELAEQLFERSATRANLKHEDCKLYLVGAGTELEPFEARFAAAVQLAPAAHASRAHRLMECAQ
ncbi:hypothetical protein A6V36_28635 [Paraburkholderia ginsengiterrae]|uniref:Uncharacterized protein n=1 Tax=Paraburkholderia ginsengiterrae TaxID=1462993 RepID=A0A1A9N0W5_9BURK|nr:hypothetical protein [Paraburkholderia ginsengiterrae]OAJ53471.1 hypothetical protein A6V37_08780 [Paraburkholderia ginsengiterrae]OAJ59023.1 hypothetical protein A6V36_28635 [Paraburkholderia ginsengiterrae]